MKTQALLIAGLGVLLASGVSLSQEQVSEKPKDVEPIPSADGTVTRIVTIKHCPVDDIQDLLMALARPGEEILMDERSNRLILRAPQEHMKEMLSLIEQLDVPDIGAPQTQPLTYRVYMLEIPSTGRDLKPFSIVLERPSQWSSPELLDAVQDEQLQIGALHQSDEWAGPDKWQLAIQGRAASHEAVKRMVEKVPESNLVRLEWDEETFTADVPAAQISRLPAPLQEHLRKFLGEQIQSVGYWFGSLLLPGEVKAPIGPWTLELKAEAGGANDLRLEVDVTWQSPVPFVPPTRILSNSVQGKIGRPIIIGYNRQSYGTRKMGAMVILPEAETTPPGDSQTKMR